jgi:hypothetical protein
MSIEYQVSIKAVITVPYQLGEGEVVNYLIESHSDVVKSRLEYNYKLQLHWW